MTVSASPDGWNLAIDGPGQGQEYRALLDKEWRTRGFELRIPGEGTALTARLGSGQVLVEGTLRGKAVKRETRLDNKRFYHYFTNQMRAFIVSDAKSIAFISLRPDSLEAMDFEATKLERLNLTVAGKATPVWKVKISLAGLLSAFWSATVHYRASDGVMVRNEAKDEQGVPYLTELVGE